MNIPNLPTDSLYKFMAISGLLVYLFSVFYPMYRQGELTQRSIILEGDVRVLGVEIKHTKTLVENTKGHAFKPSDPDVPKILEYQKAIQNIQTRRNQIRAIESEIKLYNSFCWAGAVLGAILIGLGFGLWYFRVQRLQDILLRREATGQTKDGQ